MQASLMERINFCHLADDLAELWIVPWGGSVIVVHHLKPDGKVSTATIWKPQVNFTQWRETLEYLGLADRTTAKN